MSKNLKNDSISKLFLSYLVPTVAGMLVMSLHIVIDGIFVGRGVGSDALAAVNIVVPFFSIFTAIGLLIGLGGSTVVSVKFGEGKDNEASSIFTQGMILTLLIILVITTASLINIEKLSYALGANDKLLHLVKCYVKIILYFSIIFVLENALSCFVRNDGAPMFSMFCMIMSAIINCVLDYIFIFKFNWGIQGAALATGIGTTFGIIILLFHFILKKGKLKFVKTKLVFNDIFRIFKNGLPSFIAEISLSITTLAHNLILMKILGEIGVSTYSIINYIHVLMLMVFMGIAQAIQPIISYNYGAKQHRRISKTLNLSIIVSIALGLFFLLAGIFFGKNMAMLFVKNDINLINLTIDGIKIFFLSYLFMGCNMVLSVYFQSIENPIFSTIITLCRGLIFIIVGLLILPKIFNVTGIWLATPIAEFLTIIVSCFLLKLHKKQINTLNLKIIDI